MRRIVVFDRVSADGYFTTEAGDLNWVVQDDEVDKAGGEASPGADNMVLFGRRTYQMFESFWPHVLDGSGTAPDPHRPGRRSPAMHGMAVWLNEATKLVFSRTLKAVNWNNVRIAGEFDPAEVAAIKKTPGKDIMIFGSGTIVSLLTEHGLVDEYQFVVSPIMLGSGRQLISGVPKHARVRLAEAKPFATGNVMLRYTLEP